MTGPPLQHEDAFAKAKQLRDAGVPLNEIDRYLASRLGGSSSGGASPVGKLQEEYRAGTLAPRMATENAQEATATPTVGTELLGTGASLARDIPGAEAAQAAVAAAASHIPGLRPSEGPVGYREALREIHDAEESAGGLGTAARIAGGSIAAAATPGAALKIGQRTILSAPVVQGTLFGGARGAASADPTLSARDRVTETVRGGVVGGASGKAADVLGTLARAKFGPRAGRSVVERKNAMAEADAANYGAVDRAASGTQGLAQTPAPEVSAALSQPHIQDWADAVRSSVPFQRGKYGPQNDFTVLREVYKDLGQAQRAGFRRTANSSEYLPLTQRDLATVKAAKQDLLAAADAEGPEFRAAVEAHAEHAGNLSALLEANKAGRGIATGTEVGAGKLGQTSGEAFAQRIGQMNAEKATAAQEGLLAALKNKSGLTINPLTGFGAGQSLVRANRAAPYVRALDAQSGDRTNDMLRAVGIELGTLP